MSEVTSDVVPVDDKAEPIKVAEEDYESLREVSIASDRLVKLRQELGRLMQVINNVRVEADKAEREANSKKTELAQKYGLDKLQGQWALDFEKKEFVKVVNNGPVVV